MRITHGRISLELHELTRRDGLPLLLLHSLCGSSADWGEAPATWPGPVFALDFSGHGHSDWVVGGAYYPEMLAGDADAALAHIGTAAVAGAGVGAYVALLLAGARSAIVPATLLVAGRGLAGGGPQPDYEREFPEFTVAARRPGLADPMVLTLERDVRPVDYAEAFARAATRILLLEEHGQRPEVRPPWWEAARRSPAAQRITADLPSALALLHAATQLITHH